MFSRAAGLLYLGQSDSAWTPLVKPPYILLPFETKQTQSSTFHARACPVLATCLPGMPPGSMDAFAGMAARHPANERRPWSVLLRKKKRLKTQGLQDDTHRLHGIMMTGHDKQRI